MSTAFDSIKTTITTKDSAIKTDVDTQFSAVEKKVSDTAAAMKAAVTDAFDAISKKFSDTLTHRDFLGSVMGLGIERNKIGDIIVRENEGYIFTVSSISEYIKENLGKVRHTTVSVDICDEIPEAIEPVFSEQSIIVSSNRLDAILAGVYKLSRDRAVRYISEGKVFVSGRQMTENSKQLKPGNTVSVRGKGKFIFEGEGGATRKDKLYINVKLYV